MFLYYSIFYIAECTMFNNEEILEIPDASQYWLVRAGNNAEFYKDFQYNNFIAIGGNEIKLEDLLGIDNYYKVSDDDLKKQYKDKFFRVYYDRAIENDAFSKNPNHRQEEIRKLERSSRSIATKTFNFVEKMKIGDFVIVPDNGSKHFSLGVITSKVFDYEINHVAEEETLDDDLGVGYHVSDFEKKRRVLWIKEFGRKSLPDKLSWIRQTRQTIYNLTSDAEQINPLVSANYIYKGEFHSRIGVTTDRPVSSKDLFEFQKTILDIVGNKAAEIHQKISVQSPGFILLQTSLENYQYLAMVIAVLFGSFSSESHGIKIKVTGLMDKILNWETDKKLSEEKVRGLKLDNDHKELENKIKEFELRELELQLDREKIEIDREKLENLKLNNSEVGDEIPLEKQMDNLSESPDRLQKKQ